MFEDRLKYGLRKNRQKLYHFQNEKLSLTRSQNQTNKDRNVGQNVGKFERLSNGHCFFKFRFCIAELLSKTFVRNLLTNMVT